MTEKRIEWLWKCNDDLLLNENLSEWNRYSDIENVIIEEAYTTLKKSNVMLDDYHIDFEQGIQIANDDINKQHLIKREEINKEDKRLRATRFMSDPIAPTSSFHDLIGYKKIFIDEFIDLFNLKSVVDWEYRKHELVEKAMAGILYEGQLAGKQHEAKWIIEQLEKVKNKTKKDIGECCVYLYTLESFLYKTLNHTMRLISEKKYENIWRNKIETLGPFTFLLNYYLSYESVSHRTSTTVYRGAQLTDEMIDQYKKAVQSKDSRRSFQAFTSCSRNRIKAEQFGNTLFIFNPKTRTSYRTLNMDISFISAYPNEEEVLIKPGRAFEIERVDYDKDKKKHIIYLISISTSDKN
ncbi:unnamed protein product [Adineta steineri]|uniref:NAD(P)(+)--arginine ADP-ribosyltransferase n=1 Tax=Adineta steineri TaxID=433720 RepID=A0A818XQN7_9BILA|nr:unnamed protein product [Adineta steineri]CAF1242074.1 unnamed protein product [Adineta steineri]CAF1290500.1 unnamed protein product [Adineta steineri]CAF3742946.1 unnamed protein product [Adineta steineri]CAF3807839.1 unnamed protein product [Adineta steineri]